MPEPSELEREITPIIDAVLAEGGTGYRWSAVDAKAKRFTGVRSTRTYRVTESGRVYNIPREIKNFPDIALVVVREYEFDLDQLVSTILDYAPRREPMARMIVFLTKTDEWWRGVEVLTLEGDEPDFDITDHFPSAGEPRPLLRQRDGRPAPDVRPPLEVDEIRQLPDHVMEYAAARGLVFSMTTIVDAIACTLSSQYVLLAGPSGSGKSTLADVLMTFFAPPELRATIRGRKGMTHVRDLVGAYSTFKGEFVPRDETWALLDLAHASSSDDGVGAPFLLVEEAGLSRMEDYLNPWFHGYSAIVAESIELPLWERDTDEEDPAIPETLVFSRYPRLLGTLNVDAEAPAPSKRVAARAAVLLLEADRTLTARRIASLVTSDRTDGADERYAGVGARFVGDPEAALANDAIDLDSMASVLDQVVGEIHVHTKYTPDGRSLKQCLLYMSYFVLLAPAATPDVVRLAAENAVLHFVLPGVPAEGFTTLLNHAENLTLAAPSGDERAVGGMLKQRIAKLSEGRTGLLASLQPTDFWAALS